MNDDRPRRTPAEKIAALVAAAGAPGADVLAIVRQLAALGGQLAGAGQVDEGVHAQRAAVALLREVGPPVSLSAANLTLLAESLHNLAERLRNAGQEEEAAGEARQAIGSYAQAAHASGADVGGIAWNLTLLSKFFTSLGLSADALSAQQTSVQVLEGSPPMEPQPAYETLLAEMRHNLALRLIDVGRVDDADAAAAAAIAGYGHAAALHLADVSSVARDLVALAKQLTTSGLTALAARAQAAAAAALRDLELPESTGTFVDPAAPGAEAAEAQAQARARVSSLKAQVKEILIQLRSLNGELIAAGLTERAGLAEATSAGLQPTRYCAVPDEGVGDGVGPLAYGAPKGRWPRGNLSVSINPTGCTFSNLPLPAPQTTPTAVIMSAFVQWQMVASAFFAFTFVAAGTGEDIKVSFVGSSVNPKFGTPGGVLGDGEYPPGGTIRLDAAETWTANTLLGIALHEIGHVLGLSHSNTPGSLMYPLGPPSVAIDAESRTVIAALHGWEPQQRLPDRATSSRARLGVTSSTNFTSHVEIAHMVWKGSREDPGIYHAELLADGWTPQTRVGAVGCSHSPSLTQIRVPGSPTLATGLLMAWKGVGTDPGVYWTRNMGLGWEPQRRIAGIGSSASPSLANLNGTVYMAWKGVRDDSGIYWSQHDGNEGWSPQSRVRGVGTSDAPALVVYRARVMMFWKGIGEDHTGYYSEYEPVVEQIWRPQRRIEYADYEVGGGVSEAIGTTAALAAALRGDTIVLCWKGAEGDSGIWMSHFDGTDFGGQVRVAGIGTSVGPSVVHVDGRILMAWKGIDGDNTIWWSRL